MLIQLQYITTTLHGNTTPTTVGFMVTAVKTSNLISELVYTKWKLGRNDEITWQAKRDTTATIK
jgi:hypothetical protein